MTAKVMVNHVAFNKIVIITFSLRYLFQPKKCFHDSDPDEYVLITSPYLYSIVASYSDYDTFGRVNYNEKAALEMMTEWRPV